jgi:hypothetical protein
MFWIIFTIGMLLLIGTFILSIYEELDSISALLFTFSLAFILIMLVGVANTSVKTVSKKEKVCFNPPIPTPTSILIFTDDGIELKGETIYDMNFPYHQSKCFKQNHYNQYGKSIRTTYTFTTVSEQCIQENVFTIRR